MAHVPGRLRPRQQEAVDLAPGIGRGAAAGPSWGDRIRAVLAQLPAADPAWSLGDLHRHEPSRLPSGPGRGPGRPARSAGGLHFFSEDGTVAYDQPQQARSDGGGGFILTLPIDPNGPKDPARLVGVLTSRRAGARTARFRG